MTPKKGLKTVYQALRRLKDQGVAFRHTLIGDGEQKPEIEALRRRLGLEDETRLLGTRPHEDVCRCFRTADLFVLGCEEASNGDRDGIPNVILESMAMGVPVVATRFSAIPEVIDSEHNGLLVKPGQPAAMAAAMPSRAASMLFCFQTQIRGMPVVPDVSCIPTISDSLGEIRGGSVPDWKPADEPARYRRHMRTTSSSYMSATWSAAASKFSSHAAQVRA